MVAHEVAKVTLSVRNTIEWFTDACYYELLAKHQKAAANKVKHSIKEMKMCDMGKKEELWMMQEIRVPAREIGKGRN